MNKAAVSKIGFFSGLALFCMIFFLDEIPGLSRSGQITLCVFLLMGIWWATEALPLTYHFTSSSCFISFVWCCRNWCYQQRIYEQSSIPFCRGIYDCYCNAKVELTSTSCSNDSTVFGPQWKKNSSVIHGNQCVVKYVGDEYIYHNYASSNRCICMLCNLRYRERYQREGADQSSSLCIIRNSIFLINRWNCYTNWDRTEWFFDSVFS